MMTTGQILKQTSLSAGTRRKVKMRKGAKIMRKLTESETTPHYNWEDFSDPVTDRIEKDFLPRSGEGENMMSQAVTATTKLIYKWFNDGDVFDNNYGLEGWANDLSSYANWLDENIPEAEPILARIRNVGSDEDAYTALLYDLMHTVFTDEMIVKYAGKPKEGTIYDCDGPYNFYEAPTCPECGQECDEWDIDHYGMCSDCYNNQYNNSDEEEDFYESTKGKSSRLQEEDSEEKYLTYKGYTCGWFKEDGVLFFNDDVKGKPNNWESYDRRALPSLKKGWKADIDQSLAKNECDDKDCKKKSKKDKLDEISEEGLAKVVVAYKVDDPKKELLKDSRGEPYAVAYDEDLSDKQNIDKLKRFLRQKGVPESAILKLKFKRASA